MRFWVWVESGFATPDEIAEDLHDGVADEADADGGEAVSEGCEVRRWWRSAHALTEENWQREEASGGETRMFHGNEWMWPNANSPRTRRRTGGLSGLGLGWLNQAVRAGLYLSWSAVQAAGSMSSRGP